MLVKGEYSYVLVPPERFELPAPAFVAQCSNPNELRWCIEFESSSITVIATIDPCNKAGREGDTSLGILNTQIDYLVVYGITPPVLYTRLTFEESSQRVFLLLTLSKLGAPRQNRTAITGLQNQCTTIVLVGLKFGSECGVRTHLTSD